MVYLISYLLRTPGKNYSDLYQAIDNLSGSKNKILTSTIIIETSLSADKIFISLKPYIDTNDNLFIVRLNNDSAGVMPAGFWKWFASLSF